MRSAAVPGKLPVSCLRCDGRRDVHDVDVLRPGEVLPVRQYLCQPCRGDHVVVRDRGKLEVRAR